MKKIKLRDGLYTLVDDINYDRLSMFKWHVNKDGYVCHYIFCCKCEKRHMVMLHREILGLSKCGSKEISHHKNHNKVDNRLCNLVSCSKLQNNMHQCKRKNKSSKYKGVCYIPVGRGNRTKDKWQAGIKLNGKSIHLGYFDYETEAAMAYDKAAKSLFKNFAKVNFG